MQLQITPISRVHDIVPLLTACNLPTQDIAGPAAQFFAAHDQSLLIGVAGLELYGPDALLRSLAVADDRRKQGLGKQLLVYAEQQAQLAGVKNIYLLTGDAADYFRHHGYLPVDRSMAPETIRSTSQFRGVCPASAVLMYKAVTAAES